MTRRPYGAMLALLGAGALALGACGNSAEDEARAVVDLLAESDPALCESMTPQFLDETFEGELPRCRAYVRQYDDFADAKVRRVSVDGEEATVIARRGEHRSTISLVNRDGGWRMSGFRTEDVTREREGSSGDEEGNDRQSSSEQNGREWPQAPRGAVRAYYRAIREGNAVRLCGMLTRRYARKVLGGGRRPAEESDCVETLLFYDWAEARRATRGVRVFRAERSGDAAIVRLSDGRALLQRRRGRWLIDDIVR